MKKLSIIEADLNSETHADAVLSLTDSYARDPMGMNKPLKSEVKNRLIREMRKFNHSLCLLAIYEEKAVGLANCFYGFSTFEGKKLINIHDLAVLPSVRNKGIGEALLAAVEKIARNQGCCKITLEVREDNRASDLYERTGFKYGNPKMFFMTKSL